MNEQKHQTGAHENAVSYTHLKALVPILVPLFISAFRRADELATAMECRCYHGGEGRTRMRSLHYQGMDWVTMALFMALCVVCLLYTSRCV